MSEFMKISLPNSDQTQEFTELKMDIAQVGDWNVFRFILEPGWCWTDHAEEYGDTETCEAEHPLWTVVSGRMVVRMNDGREIEFGPGSVGYIPPGHDAWVVGDEPVIAFDYQPAN